MMSYSLKYLGKPDASGYSEQNLKEFVDRAVEENVNLDYKNIKKIENPNGLAIAVSAMANSEGGLIVLGVEERRETDDNGKSIRMLPGNITWGEKSYTREKLESLLVARVRPWIDGLRIYPIRNSSEDLVFLIDIPQSPSPPHQAPDNKYYLRYNFQNLPMEHYQVAALFYKRLRPNILPRLTIKKYSRTGDLVELSFELVNNGGAMAKYPLMMADIAGCRHATILSATKGSTLEHTDRHPLAWDVKYMDKDHFIHPETSTDIARIKMAVDRVVVMNIAVAAEDMPTAYYSAGFSLDYINGIANPDSEIDVPLSVISDNQTKEGEPEEAFRQLGVSRKDFGEKMDEIDDDHHDDESVRKAVLDLLRRK